MIVQRIDIAECFTATRKSKIDLCDAFGPNATEEGGTFKT